MARSSCCPGRPPPCSPAQWTSSCPAAADFPEPDTPVSTTICDPPPARIRRYIRSATANGCGGASTGSRFQKLSHRAAASGSLAGGQPPTAISTSPR